MLSSICTHARAVFGKIGDVKISSHVSLLLPSDLQRPLRNAKLDKRENATFLPYRG